MPRETLPGRRQSTTARLDHDGQTYHVSVGYYADGRPGEIFLTAPKASQTFAAVQAADAAVAVSIAMQYGVPLAVLRDAFLREADGSPAGILGATVDLLLEMDAAPPGE